MSLEADQTPYEDGLDWSLRGHGFLEANLLEEAEDCFRKAIRLGHSCYGDLATVLRLQGNIPAAYNALEVARERGEIGLAFELARLAEVDGDLHSAVRFYRDAILEGEVNAHLNLALLFDELGRTSEALEQFVLATDNDDATAYAPFAEFVLDAMPLGADHATETVKCLLSREMQQEQELRILHEFVAFLTKGFRHDEAIAPLQRMIDLGDNCGLMQLADIFEQREEFELAIATYEKALEDGEVVYGLIADLLERTHRTDEAVEYLEHGIAANDPFSCMRRALIYLQAGDGESAIRLLHRAIDLGAEGLHSLLATIEEELGNVEIAEREYRLALAEGDEDARDDFVEFLVDQGRTDDADVIRSLAPD